VADVYSALTSDRPYRPAMPLDKVNRIIGEMSGEHLNKEVVMMLTRTIPMYPVGHWIEVYGTLEKETHIDAHNLRELRVKSFRMVPVVPPRQAAAEPAPPQFQQPAAPAPDTTTRAEETPVATTGEVAPTLPKTASPIPAIGLLGLLSLAGGLALRFRARA